MEQNGTEDYVPPEVTAIATQNVFFPDDEALKHERDRLQASSATYQAALQEIQSRNLQARDEDSPPFGWTEVSQSVYGDQVKATTFIAAAGSDGGKDYGIMVYVVQGIDENGRLVREEHAELVEKPSGDVADPSDIKAVALFQGGAKVAGDIEARSLLSRFTKCVRSGCSSACLGSLTSCVGLWPVYLKCVIVKCGLCAVKCGACAACNCSWWCRIVAGCCRN